MTAPTRLIAQAGLVAAGGAIGASIRAVLEATFPAAPGTWPWTTFLINLTGSLMLGVLLETLQSSGPDDGWRRATRLGAGTGVIGGFTTYSTFSIEAVLLGEHGSVTLGAAYALVSIVLGVMAALAGIATAGWVHRQITQPRKDSRR